MRPAALTVLLAIGAVTAAAPVRAQTPAGGGSPDDPYEATNRGFYAGQDKLDKAIFLPLARLYHALTPGPIGKGIHNVLSNLGEPVVIFNDILQGRLRRAGHEALRMTANSTAGILGLMDVATPSGLEHHDNDFGVTLGRWGVRPGPYLYLPLIGPSTVRDAFGAGADVALDPLNFIDYPDRVAVAVSKTVVGTLDTRYQVQGQLDALLSDATDPYATLRSVYLQNREALVRGEDNAPALPPLEDEPSTDAPPPASQPSDAAPAQPTDANPAQPSNAAPPPPPGAPPAAPTPDAPPPSPAAALTPPARPAAVVYTVDNPDPDAPVATARDWRPTNLASSRPAPSA